MADLTWQQKSAERQANRQKNCAHNTLALQKAGIAFQVLDHGWHLRIEANGERIDFMPGPGTWSIAGQRGATHGKRQGVQALIWHIEKKATPETKKENEQ